MAEFVGLEGVKAKSIPGVVVPRVSALISGLRSHRALAAAGCNGCVTVWTDDAGVIRSEFAQHWITKAKAEHSSKAALRAWLREWWPKCN